MNTQAQPETASGNAPKEQNCATARNTTHESPIRSNETGHLKIVFDHDDMPDFSWLEQDIYDPENPNYDPIYRNESDMKAKRNPIDGEWYRNPENHVALSMRVYEGCPCCDGWKLIDSLHSIDFLRDSDEWATGTFYKVSDLPKGYLRDLAKEAGLPQ